VGLTRAESHLIISGSHNAGNQSSGRVHLNMVLNALGVGPAHPPESIQGKGYSVGFHLVPELTRAEHDAGFRGLSRTDPALMAPLYRD
jgi:hypothetical protein